MTEKTFIFQTGHGKGLAKAEISALLGEVAGEVMDGFIVKTDAIDDAKKLLNRMGGIVRISEVLFTAPAAMPINFADWAVKAVSEEVKNKDAKVRYGISMHPKSEKILKKTLSNSKKILKEKFGNVRFVNKNFQNLSSVQAWHENLISESAVELNLFKSTENESDQKWYFAKTLAIQDFEWYSRRDYDRPAKSAKVGMFPPKLAQMLINIATEGEKLAVFDPFCGSGTAVQEAWLMGLNAYGSDIEAKLAGEAKENMDWVKAEAAKRSPAPEGTVKIFKKDARELSESDLPEEKFCIVTETWLGPNMTAAPTRQEREKIQREIETLYEDFFRNLKKIVAEPITVVFTAPYHREGNERHFLPNLQEILERHGKVIPLSNHKRPSLFYERKQQIVSREIWKMVCEPQKA